MVKGVHLFDTLKVPTIQGREFFREDFYCRHFDSARAYEFDLSSFLVTGTERVLII